MAPTQLLSAGIGLLATLLYAFVGLTVARRSVSEQNRLANHLFAVWWFALAGASVLGAGMSLLAYAGVTDLRVFVAATFFSLALVVVALWGLLFYLLYLFTGKHWILAPLSAFYVFYAGALVYFLQSSQPDGIVTTGWDTMLHYATPQTGFFSELIMVLLLFPQIIGALALFSLVFIVREREQRFRVSVVSWSILVWFGASYVSAAFGPAPGLAVQILLRALGLGAALAILVAYNPPQRLRAWLQKPAVAVEEPSTEPPSRRLASEGSRRAGRSIPVETVL